MEAYALLLKDSFLSALVVQFGNDFIFTVMRLFGSFDMSASALVATIGATAASWINYGMGCMARIGREYRLAGKERNGGLDRAGAWFVKHGWPLLLLAWMPILHLVSMVAGFFGMSPRVALPLLLLAQLSYYISAGNLW